MITFNTDIHLWEMDGVAFATSFNLCSKRVWLFGAARKVPAWARWASVSSTGLITVYETRPAAGGGQQGFGNSVAPMTAILGGELTSCLNAGIVEIM